VSAYSPSSSFGWLDLDSAASEQVGTLLRSLEEPTTLDALGLGAVRDAISWIFSPGTSTIQTRLRYFLFLPWIFRRLEGQRVAPTEFAHRLRDSEARLIDCLRHLGPNQGVIGYTAGRDLKRMPSEAYWGGLGTWGIRRLDLTLAQYGSRAASFGRSRPERDDDGNPTLRGVSMWAALPDPPDDFLAAEATFELRRDEAQVLVDLIRERHPTTLLAFLCGRPGLAEAATFAWDVPTEGMSAHLAEAVHHARCFSELTVGPQHVYNVLLARKARIEFGWDTDEVETRQLKRIKEWAGLIGERHAELNAWVGDLPSFWDFLAPVDTISEGTRRFVESVVSRAVANPAGFAEDPVVAGCIRDREIGIKSKRARLANRSALENWNQAPFGGQLDYRWPITKSYLTDIAAGLQAGA
jgi:hypothetical protein